MSEYNHPADPTDEEWWDRAQKAKDSGDPWAVEKVGKNLFYAARWGAVGGGTFWGILFFLGLAE